MKYADAKPPGDEEVVFKVVQPAEGEEPGSSLVGAGTGPDEERTSPATEARGSPGALAETGAGSSGGDGGGGGMVKKAVLFVDPMATMYVAGTVMDWEETELSAEFTFRNPNAKGECGCGESFNV